MFENDEITQRSLLFSEVRNLAVLRDSNIMSGIKKRKKKSGKLCNTPSAEASLIVFSPPRSSVVSVRIHLSRGARLDRRDSTFPGCVCVSLCNRCYVRPALQTHSRVQYFCFSSHFFLTLLPRPDITIT